MNESKTQMELFLLNSLMMFKYYKSLGDKTFAQLSQEELFWQDSHHDNSIAIITKHMWGNMMSRWTNFLTEDGEKEWRRREAEFELEQITSKQEVIKRWEEGWKCLFMAISNIEPDNYNQLIYIRSKGHTIMEAIQRQLGHYSYHVGQIVYLGKMMKKESWTSLSIAKGESSSFTEKSKLKGNRREHFIKEQMNDESE